MAEEKNTPVDPKAQENAPKAEDKKVYNGKYESVDALEKAHSELEQKLGQQGEDLNKLRQYQADAEPIVDIVYSNDEIMSKVRQAADAKYAPPEEPIKENGKTKEEAPKVDPKVASQEAYLRQKAIEDFKVKHGLQNIPAEDYTKVEEAITDVMGRWIIPGTTVPLDKVSNLLEDAYSLVRKDKLVEDKVLESLATQQTNQQATMSPMTGESPTDSGAELTEAEQLFSKKLGVKPEDVKAYKEKAAKEDESIIK